MNYRFLDIKETNDYKYWFNDLTAKEKAKVVNRLLKIKEHGHFGDSKFLGDYLCELRWKNGWRVYFVYADKSIVLLIGGHKNEQEKNIKKARINIKYYTKDRA